MLNLLLYLALVLFLAFFKKKYRTSVFTTFLMIQEFRIDLFCLTDNVLQMESAQ